MQRLAKMLVLTERTTNDQTLSTTVPLLNLKTVVITLFETTCPSKQDTSRRPPSPNLSKGQDLPDISTQTRFHTEGHNSCLADCSSFGIHAALVLPHSQHQEHNAVDPHNSHE